jgi:hypothetical protein
MKYVTRDDGREAIPDDAPPVARAVLLLLEHANQRRDAGLALPCTCRECGHHRAAVRCVILDDGTLAVESA